MASEGEPNGESTRSQRASSSPSSSYTPLPPSPPVRGPLRWTAGQRSSVLASLGVPGPGRTVMPGTDSRRQLGAAGETAACAHLERRGYRILARNARADRVELDIVAERAGVLVFVEVKTRRTADCGGAVEAVAAGNSRRMRAGWG